MDWKHYEARQSGRCHIDIAGNGEVADFELGLVETGRSRVFWGHYIKIVDLDGETWIGESPVSLRKALRALDDEVASAGGRLLCAGLHHRFSESGLSVDTGYGYLEGRDGPVHLMERPSLIDKDEAQASPPGVAAELLAALRERMRDEP
jgi:hypothetical protein